MKDNETIKQLKRIVEVQREQLKQLKADEEIKGNTEIQQEIVMPDIVNVDLYEFNKIKDCNGSCEIRHLQFQNRYNEPKEYFLTRDVKGCLYKER